MPKERYVVTVSRVVAVEHQVVEQDSYMIDNYCRSIEEVFERFASLRAEPEERLVVTAKKYVEPTPEQAICDAAKVLQQRAAAAQGAQKEKDP